jgi:glycosyltransferase involved in cell wall biosynthesis
MNRIVYVCHTFPWVTQTFTIREVALLRDSGHAVEVVAFHRPQQLMDERARELLSITHYVPPLASLAFVRGVVRGAARRPAAFASLFVAGFASSYLARTTWSGRARGVLDVLRGAYIAGTFRGVGVFHSELVDNACSSAMTAGQLSGTPFSFKSHSSYNPQALARKSKQAALIALASAFDATFYFANVEPKTKLFVNRGGVTEQSGERRVRDGALSILCIGTLQEKKGQTVLVEAVRILRDRGVPVACTIVGSGPLAEVVRERIESAGLTDVVSLGSYRPHAELQELYAEHEVFALPCVVASNGDRDGLPAVLIEAAAAGCVLVSTPVSGIPELIEDCETGLLVPEHDAAALADALERLAGDRALRELLRAGGRRVVAERFDLRRNVAELAERFEQI